jgi:hypothetical protein
VARKASLHTQPVVLLSEYFSFMTNLCIHVSHVCTI